MGLEPFEVEDIQGRLRALLVVHAAELPARWVGQVEEFIDVGELGLALTELVALLDQERVALSQETFADISDLVTRMEVDRSYIDRARALLAT